jgi:uncharacterized repeat protein (TIGR01451 family)
MDRKEAAKMLAHSKSPQRTLKHLIFALAFVAIATQPALAQEGKGAATGLKVQAATDEPLLGGLNINLTAAEVDEGPTNAPFDESKTVVALSVLGGTVAADTISAGTRHVPAEALVRSDAATENLAIDLNLLGVNLVDLTSGTITSNALVAGPCGQFTATGQSVIEDLTLSILGESVTVALHASPLPNTVLLDALIEVDLDGKMLSADAFVILNERNVAGDQSQVDVNALRISLDISVTDALVGVPVLAQTVDVIVSRSEAAFVNCLADADLQLSKSVDTNPATVGGSLSYTMVITNHGPADARNVVLSDHLDARLTINNASASGAGSCTVSGQQITCSWTMIASGDSRTVAVITTPTAAGTVTNAARVTADNPDPNPAQAEDSVEVVVVVSALGDADLQLSKSANPNPTAVGRLLTYTLAITNNGPADAENLVVNDRFDGRLTINSASASGGGNCTVTGQQINCSWAIVVSGQSVVATIDTTPTEPGTVNNSASAVSDNPDPNPSVSTDSVVVSVLAAGEIAGALGDPTPIPSLSPPGFILLILLIMAIGMMGLSANRRG